MSKILFVPLSAVLLLLPACATQQTFVVNTTQDARDSNPGDGACLIPNSPDLCSLRAAVEEVNAGPAGTDYDITVPLGTYALQHLAGVANSHEGLRLEGRRVDINGSGAFETIIEPASSMRGFTIMGGLVSLNGLTIQNGSTIAAGNGGAVHVSGDAYSLVMDDCRILDNEASFRGGGIFATGPDNFTSLTISNCRIEGNSAGFGGQGGGGGIFSSVPTGITRSTIEENASSNGGGITISGVRFDITRSAIVKNDGVNGAGLKLSNAEAVIRRTTISGNTSCNIGGGIQAFNSVTDLGDVTIYENTIGTILNPGSNNEVSTCNTSNGAGAGVHLSGDSPFEMRNSVIAQNEDPFELNTASDCFGTLESGGFNWVGSNNGCNVLTLGTDHVGIAGNVLDPELGILTTASSPTPYHLPASDSQLVDSGGGCAVVDQRGNPRPVDGDNDGAADCDIGAVERQ